eukprot:3453836-Rhodomonas_salina.2
MAWGRAERGQEPWACMMPGSGYSSTLRKPRRRASEREFVFCGRLRPPADASAARSSVAQACDSMKTRSDLSSKPTVGSEGSSSSTSWHQHRE